MYSKCWNGQWSLVWQHSRLALATLPLLKASSYTCNVNVIWHVLTWNVRSQRYIHDDWAGNAICLESELTSTVLLYVLWHHVWKQDKWELMKACVSLVKYEKHCRNWHVAFCYIVFVCFLCFSLLGKIPWTQSRKNKQKHQSINSYRDHLEGQPTVQEVVGLNNPNTTKPPQSLLVATL